MTEFKSTWWSVRLPETWVAKPEESHVGISRAGGPGALHISCVKKEKGPVSSRDLNDWAAEHGHGENPWASAQFGTLSGLGRRRVDGSRSWHEWYLACGRLLFFVTYNCPVGQEAEEFGEVTSILVNIEPKESGA